MPGTNVDDGRILSVRSYARAMMDSDKDAEEIARKAITVAAEICVFTNGNMIVESLDA